MRGGIAWLVTVAVLLIAPRASADDPRPPSDDPTTYATFAIILGVNASVDTDAPTLHYADDDAARYVDLFRSLGARTYVLTRLDEGSRRLYPQIAAEAVPPVRAEFERVTASLARDVERARGAHVKTILYFAYAGHGNAQDGRGYITLEDSRLDGATLDREVVDGIGADRTHFIVDACDSFFLALGRGPGGQRHAAHGFTALGGLRVRDSVGLLLSTSSAGQSHEWSGFQAGVFSHEVRSALYGAADADGDGLVSYREVSAFVERANQSIPNEQYRPDVYARPPKDTPVLLDLRGRQGARIDVPSSHAGRYLLEDGRGVRIADFHSAPGQLAYLVRPPHVGRLYLRRLDGDEAEFVIPSGPDRVAISDLPASEPREASRGAANDAYEMLFAWPFDLSTVRSFVMRAPPEENGGPASPGLPAWRIATGAALLAGAVGAGIVGGLTLHAARDDASQASALSVSGAAVAQANDRIRARNVQAALELGGAAAAGLGGALLFLWPQAAARASADVSLSSWTLSIHGTF